MRPLAAAFAILLAGCSEESGPAVTRTTPSPSQSPSPSPSGSPSASPSASPSSSATPSPSANPKAALEDPSKLNEKAPAEFKVKFDTSKGEFVVRVVREWAPNGADRFYNLAKHQYFDDIRFFRVVQKPKPFMAQFGIHGDPKLSAKWSNSSIQDDPVKKSNTRGFVTYAQTSRPNSRSTQLFINYGDNSFLDGQRFAPFGEVVEGMKVVDSFYAEYGEETTSKQGQIVARGNAFLAEKYPKLDYIKTARIVQ